MNGHDIVMIFSQSSPHCLSFVPFPLCVYVGIGGDMLRHYLFIRLPLQRRRSYSLHLLTIYLVTKHLKHCLTAN